MRSKRLKTVVEMGKATFSEWSEDKAARLAAAIAYYAVFSLGPLLIIAIAIIGFVYGQEAAQGKIAEQMQGLFGQNGAEAIQTMAEAARKPSAGIIATIISVIVLMFTASGLFIQLQDSLNTIWEVTPKPGRGIMTTIRQRFLSFSLVLGIGFLLLVSLLISAGLSAFGDFFVGLLPGLEYVMKVLHFFISFGVITLLFAMIYKFLPDVKITWDDVWIGAAATALLFTIGKFFIGMYLGRSSTASAYGAVGSLVVLMLWNYYSAMIFLMGAEFTQIYANKYGSRMVPSEGAIPLTEEMRAEQGIPHTRERVAAATGRKEETLQPWKDRTRTGTYATGTKHPDKSIASHYTVTLFYFIYYLVTNSLKDHKTVTEEKQKEEKQRTDIKEKQIVK